MRSELYFSLSHDAVFQSLPFWADRLTAQSVTKSHSDMTLAYG